MTKQEIKKFLADYLFEEMEFSYDEDFKDSVVGELNEIDKLKEENEFLKLSLKVSRRNNEELSMHNYYDVYRKMTNFIIGLHSKDLYFHNEMTPEVMRLLNYIEGKFEELLKSCENER